MAGGLWWAWQAHRASGKLAATKPAAAKVQQQQQQQPWQRQQRRQRLECKWLWCSSADVDPGHTSFQVKSAPVTHHCCLQARLHHLSVPLWSRDCGVLPTLSHRQAAHHVSETCAHERQHTSMLYAMHYTTAWMHNPMKRGAKQSIENLTSLYLTQITHSKAL